MWEAVAQARVADVERQDGLLRGDLAGDSYEGAPPGSLPGRQR